MKKVPRIVDSKRTRSILVVPAASCHDVYRFSDPNLRVISRPMIHASRYRRCAATGRAGASMARWTGATGLQKKPSDPARSEIMPRQPSARLL
jgi:hypothetical protein